MSIISPLIFGEYYTRSDLVLEYGGAVSSGGIVASKTSNTVFVFTDPSKGEDYGYVYDGFSLDGSVFHYTGAGQDGDQVLSRNNASILRHAEQGRTLHAFVAAGVVPGSKEQRIQRYIGEFILDPSMPFTRRAAPSKPKNKDDKPVTRTVIVFRMLPIHAISDELIKAVGFSDVAREKQTLEVPVEMNSTEFFETNGTAAGISLRRESQLVDDFVASQLGHEFSRWSIAVGQEPPLLTDVYDKTDRILYEAKALSGRSDVRMAVGQLYDYRRHLDVEDLRCSVLLPERPKADLRDLLESAGLGLVFREGDRFESASGSLAIRA